MSTKRSTEEFKPEAVAQVLDKAIELLMSHADDEQHGGFQSRHARCAFLAAVQGIV